jgi:hypothetical protein
VERLSDQNPLICASTSVSRRDCCTNRFRTMGFAEVSKIGSKCPWILRG